MSTPVSSGDTPPASAPVPVIPQTPARLQRKGMSTTIFAIGTILSVIVDSTEVLKETFSGVVWLPKALICIGIAWIAWQRITDTGKAVAVNYTESQEGNNADR